MTLTGDFAGLESAAERIARLGTEGPRAVSAALTRTAQGLLRDEFAGKHGPDGQGWQPNKRGTPTLHSTGALEAAATSPQDTGHGFTLSVAIPYAELVQGGTSRMVARPFLPSGGAAPAAWSEAFDEAAERALEEIVR
jgi:hypothetical protein